MRFGRAIRVARALTGLQQKELAAKAGIDASHVCLIEQGRRTPSVGVIEKLSNALGVPPHLLTLLASEHDDLKSIQESEMQAISKSLLKILLEAPEK